MVRRVTGIHVQGCFSERRHFGSAFADLAKVRWRSNNPPRDNDRAADLELLVAGGGGDNLGKQLRAASAGVYESFQFPG